MQFPGKSGIDAATDLASVSVRFVPYLHLPCANIQFAASNMASSLANTAYATNVKSGVLL